MRDFALLCVLLMPFFGCLPEKAPPETRSDYNAIWACEVAYISMIPPCAPLCDQETTSPVFEAPAEESPCKGGSCPAAVLDPDLPDVPEMESDAPRPVKKSPVRRKGFRRIRR